MDLNELNELKQKLTADKEALNNAQTEKDILKATSDSIGKEIAELRNRISELRSKNAQIDRDLWDTRKKVKELEESVNTSSRAVVRAEEDNKVLEGLKRQGEILDILTANAPWRKDILPHQLEGAKILTVAKRGILGDKRGLGKTLTSLAWLDMLNIKKALILLPKETATAFRKQVPRWASHRKPFFDLTAKPPYERDFVLSILSDMNKYLVMINIEAWRKDSSLIDKIANINPEAVIIDEAHAIKDPKTRAFLGVSSIVYPENGKGPDKVLPMSGTPYLNYPDELWPLLYLIDKEAWPTREGFRKDYLIQTGAGKWRFNPYSGAEKTLLEAIGIRLVQRDRKAAGVIIPPQEIVVHELEFDKALYPEQYDAYCTLEYRSAMLVSNMEESRVMGVEGLALMTRLRQMLVYPKGIVLRDPETKEVIFKCDINESVKIDAAVNLINQLVLQEEERVVLFSQFKAPLYEIEQRLRKLNIRVCILDGSTSIKQREVIKNDFDAQQTKKEECLYDVVLSNYKVGGQSIDLTGATQLIVLDKEWNPGKEEQSYGRIDRMGQTSGTTVHVLTVPDTIDDEMTDIIASKAEGITSFENKMKTVQAYLQTKIIQI